MRLRICVAALGLLFLVGPGCDDPPAVPSPDTGNVSEKVEALRKKVESESQQMREDLKPALDDVSVPSSPDAGPSN